MRNLEHGPWTPPSGQMPYCKLFFLLSNSLQLSSRVKCLTQTCLLPSFKVTCRTKDKTHEVANVIQQAELRKSQSQRRGPEEVGGMCSLRHSLHPDPRGRASVLLRTYKGWLRPSLITDSRCNRAVFTSGAPLTTTVTPTLLFRCYFLLVFKVLVHFELVKKWITQQGGQCQHNSPDYFVGELKRLVKTRAV